MELFFNELSIEAKEKISKESVSIFVEVYRALLKYEITTCRISSEDNHKLHQMIQSPPDFLNISNFYFSFFRSPYESEDVEKNQDEFLEHEWLYHDRTCFGFSFAVILNSAALSIYEEEWDNAFIPITKDGVQDTARNISVEKHVEIHIPQILAESDSELVECDLRIEEKKISLRDDHGKDVLMDFSKRLIRCPYVMEIVNSLPYNSHERKFIRKIRSEGMIEIVLPWTDKGYGVVVKTTGRTRKETETIGKIIEEKYGGV